MRSSATDECFGEAQPSALARHSRAVHTCGPVARPAEAAIERRTQRFFTPRDSNGPEDVDDRVQP